MIMYVERYNTNIKIEFKTMILKFNLCVYSGAHMLVKVNKTITRQRAVAVERKVDEWNKQETLKICASFTDYISEVDNAKVNNAKDLYVAMPMYNLIEYDNNYAKTSAKFVVALQRWFK